MWENYNNTKDVKFEELFSVLKNLDSKDIQSMIKLITIKKLSGKWPYDAIKERFNNDDKFKKYFKEHINSFDKIYVDWKEHAERNKSN
jgi:hypothetical protein